jgi:hypothetical protein
MGILESRDAGGEWAEHTVDEFLGRADYGGGRRSVDRAVDTALQTSLCRAAADTGRGGAGLSRAVIRHRRMSDVSGPLTFTAFSNTEHC